MESNLEIAGSGSQQPSGGAGVGMRACRARGDGAGAEGLDPRVVTTGGKVEVHPVSDAGKVVTCNVDLETGEPISLYWQPQGARVVRHIVPRPETPSSRALVDTLAFSVIPPNEHRPWAWLIDQMREHLPIDVLKSGRGCFGFKESIRFGEGAGLIAWGGASQRGRVYFSIQGKGCSLVRNWADLAQWLAEHKAKIKRVDLAYDDELGELVNVTWARLQYESDGFTAGGRRPVHCVIGDWLAGAASTSGRTLGIGRRSNGKYCRIYEKGKQLGNPESPWTRLEVEWRAQDRLIPLDILTSPGGYLAGAYPCLAFLDIEQSRIRTTTSAAQISFDAAVDHLRTHGGKLVNLMLQAYGGDCGRVVAKLRRAGLPERVLPYSQQLAEHPETLDHDDEQTNVDANKPTN